MLQSASVRHILVLVGRQKLSLAREPAIKSLHLPVHHQNSNITTSISNTPSTFFDCPNGQHGSHEAIGLCAFPHLAQPRPPHLHHPEQHKTSRRTATSLQQAHSSSDLPPSTVNRSPATQEDGHFQVHLEVDVAIDLSLGDRRCCLRWLWHLGAQTSN